MPTAINNGLPHIAFDLGTSDSLVELCGLMNTCGALNAGCSTFHLWLKSKRPDRATGLIHFDDSNPFEPVKLGGAVRDPSDFNAADHGNLTAIIHHSTPCPDANGAGVTIYFALGANVMVSTIFGLPMLCAALDSAISLWLNSIHS
jgi:hypothetical protein